MNDIYVQIIGLMLGVEMVEQVNVVIDLLQENIGGIFSKNVVGGVDVLFIEGEVNNGILIFFGIFLVNIDVIVLVLVMCWVIVNNIVGVFMFGVKVVGGVGIVVL